MRYPEYYAGKSKEEIIDIFNSFCIVLADANQISIAGALKSYMDSTESAYPPTAQQLFAKAKKMPSEMWELSSCSKVTSKNATEQDEKYC